MVCCQVTAQVRFRVPLTGKCRLRRGSECLGSSFLRLQLSCECYAGGVWKVRWSRIGGLELEEVVDYVAKHAGAFKRRFRA